MLNGQYLSVRNVTLRYSVPARYTQRVKISRMSLFASVENPYIYSHFPKGMMPGLAVQGGTVGGGLGYPFMKKASVGVNMSF
jgi:hypothetical protein